MQPIEIKRVLVVGAGTIGSQIALQCARYGFDTVIYDPDPNAEASCRRRQEDLLDEWQRLGRIDSQTRLQAEYRVSFAVDQASAASGADILIESVPEVHRTKSDVFRQFDALCPAHCLFVTTASYFTPGMFARFVSRRGQFAAFHFHEPVWLANVVDIMPHAGTSPETIVALHAFAQHIDQTPILCRREAPGYVFNVMLQSLLTSAMHLAADGIVDFKDVDRAWMGVTKMPIGPFGILDRIGLDTVQAIVRFWSMAAAGATHKKSGQLLDPLVAEGRLGIKAGRGFYDYPNPEFERPDFLRGVPPEIPRQ